MNRDALTVFFRRAVLAALPLVATGCGSNAIEAATDMAPTPICDGGFYARDLSNTCMTGGGGAIVDVLDGGLGGEDCVTRCGQGSLVTCSEERNSACQAVVVCNVACIGRVPAGLAPARARGGALGRYWAEAAHLEAASVRAFRRLRAELFAHQAPQRLADGCLAAARDEVRHARNAGRLASRFGSTPPTVQLDAARPRSLMELAIENAREGCIGETFGALVATWQARAAADREIRAHLEGIVADETRHAELAWAIDAWLRTRLDAAERAHLEAVRADALAALTLACEAPVDGELARAAGVPAPAVAQSLLRSFAAEVARRA